MKLGMHMRGLYGSVLAGLILMGGAASALSAGASEPQLDQPPVQKEQSTVEQMLADLENDDLGVRYRTLEEYQALVSTSSEAVTKLVDNLHHHADPRVRGLSAQLLANVADGKKKDHTSEVVAALAKALEDDARYRSNISHPSPPPIVRNHALLALERFGEDAKPAVAGLVKLLSPKYTKDRRLFSLTNKVLMAIGPAATDALPALTAIAEGEETAPDDPQQDGMTDRQCLAIHTIAHIHPERSLPHVISLLSDDNIKIRIPACALIRRIGPAAEDAIPTLLVVPRSLQGLEGTWLVESSLALASIGEPVLPHVRADLRSDNQIRLARAFLIVQEWNTDLSRQLVSNLVEAGHSPGSYRPEQAVDVDPITFDREPESGREGQGSLGGS